MPEDEEGGEEGDILYGDGKEERGRSSGSKKERTADDEEEEPGPDQKKRRLESIRQSEAKVINEIGVYKYDGAKQKVNKMLLDLEFGKKSDKTEDVTRVMEKLADREGMDTPHEDSEKWADIFKNTVFIDDVNGGHELDKEKVIEARMTEMQFFQKMGVYRKVPRAEVKKQGGKIISTRWIDTDKGFRGKANYRSRLVA